jgi:hypothetical protein
MGVGIIFCVFSWVCGLAVIWMDKEADRREGVLDIRKS